MRNLFLCHTPLQTLIAQQLIKQTAPIPADLVMICYAETDNAKFRHYFQQTAKLCETADFILVPKNKFKQVTNLPKIKKNLKKQYNTIYISSIDSPNFQYLIGRLKFIQLETFDDGTANLYPDSIFYHNAPYIKQFIRRLQGIHYNTEDLRRLSSRHHTLYPNQPNITQPTIPVKLWENNVEATVSGNLKMQTILLGQPVFSSTQQNVALFNYLIQKIKTDNTPVHYFPHPREHYQLDCVEYINSPFIFEDYLLQNLQQHPDYTYQIYHLASTAALNVATFPRTQITAIQPNHALFQSHFFPHLYHLMEKMNIPIVSLSDNLNI